MKNTSSYAVFALLALSLASCEKESAEEMDLSRETDAPAAAGRPQEPPARVPMERFDVIIESFNRGIGLMDRYKPVEAVQAFEDVVQLAPDWTTGRLNLGIALLNSETDEGYSRAEEEFGKVLESDPGNRYAHYSLGVLLRHLSRFDEAIAHLDRLLKSDPEDPDAHYQLGILLVDTDPQAAREHLAKTLEKVPHHESACYRLQILLRKVGEVEASRELLRRFQALKNSGAGVTSGMAYGEMGRYAEVVRAFDYPRETTEGDGAPAYTDRVEEVGLQLPAAGMPGYPPRDLPPYVEGDFGPGVGVVDVDGDGDLDCLVTGLGQGGISANLLPIVLRNVSFFHQGTRSCARSRGFRSVRFQITVHYCFATGQITTS